MSSLMSMRMACRATARLMSRNLSTEVTSAYSAVHHPYDLQRAHFDQVVPTKNVFAVCQILGRQFKVTEDDVIVSDKISGVDIGEELTVSDVLLVGSRYGTLVGQPKVPGAQVTLEVEELTKDKKVIALKHRRRKNSRRSQGHRRELTILRVKSITTPADAVADLKL